MGEYEKYVLVYKGEYDEYITKVIENCAGVTFHKHVIIFSGPNNSAFFAISAKKLITLDQE